MISEERFAELEQKIDALLQEKEKGIELSVDKTIDNVGRVTIPKSIRKVLGWGEENTQVKISIFGDKILIEKI